MSHELTTPLARMILEKATFVRGRPREQWPAWSTCDILAVAVVLDEKDVLDAAGFSMAEAFDYIGLDARVLSAIERQLQKQQPEETLGGRVIWR